MIALSSDHCRIVREALTKEKPVDEETLNSLAVLSERLDQLKRANKDFSGVVFSSYVEELKGHKTAMTVG
jgi:hypothetical protein